MIKLSAERVNEILQKETPKTEVLPTILRSIYNRYMHLFERYFEDIDVLNDDTIAELKKYHEETRGLVKYYYMDMKNMVRRYLINLGGCLLLLYMILRKIYCFGSAKTVPS